MEHAESGLVCAKRDVLEDATSMTVVLAKAFDERKLLGDEYLKLHGNLISSIRSMCPEVSDAEFMRGSRVYREFVNDIYGYGVTSDGEMGYSLTAINTYDAIAGPFSM